MIHFVPTAVSRRLVIWLSVFAGVTGSGTAAEPIRYAGQPAELAIYPCTAHSLRIVLAPVGAEAAVPLPGSPVFAPRDWPDAAVRWRTLDGSGEKRVGDFTVRIRTQPLTVTISDGKGREVQELLFDAATPGFAFRSGTRPLLGLGEGGPQFDRRGAVFPPLNGQRTPDRAVAGARIAVPYLIGTEGWALFVVSSAGTLDLSGTPGRFQPPADAPAALDLIVADATDPVAWMREMAELTGKAVLPPKWALGYMQSHRTLENSAGMLSIAETFRARKLPCDAVIYLGTGFCPAGWNKGHDSLEFNPAVFDRPAAEVIADFHKQNFQVVVHVTPPTVERIKGPGNDPWKDLRFPWDGGALHGDFSDPPNKTGDSNHIVAYWRRHEPAFAAGVDGWWPDEGDWFNVESRFARARLYYDGPLSSRPGRRPWNLQRNGYTGVARYGGWIWSGDVESRWAALAAQVPVGINHSLTVSPYWGTDTGGFHPSDELTGELFVRWFQFSAFCPSFRSHGRAWKLRLPWGWSTSDPGPLEGAKPPRPGELPNPQVEEICRKYLELRYRLLPYNYTLARQAHDTGLPMMRALWLHCPADAKAVSRGDEYLWGRDLLVAPVVERGAAKRSIYLPAGGWYDWWTGDGIAGGVEILRPVDLGTLPLFVRAGAIIPLDPVRQYAMEPVTGPTTLRVYPGADGEFTLYEDEGDTNGYKNGACATIPILWNDRARTLTVGARKGTYPGMIPRRDFHIVVAGQPQAIERTVTYNGQPLTLEIRTP